MTGSPERSLKSIQMFTKVEGKVQKNLPLKYWMSVVKAEASSSEDTCSIPATKIKAVMKASSYTHVDSENVAFRVEKCVQTH